MRKLFFTFMAFMLFSGVTLNAQVTIGSDEAPATSAILDLKNLPNGKSDKAMLITRVDNVSAITNPENGMMVYDISSKCFRFFQNNKWSVCFGEYISTPNLTSLPIGSGTLTGKAFFDIAQGNSNHSTSCGLLEARIANRADLTQTATNTQTYTFTPSGAVSNVRFMYINNNGSVITSIDGGNVMNNITTPVTVTVKYNPNLNNLALGLTKANALKAEIYAVYNDNATNTGIDKKVKLNVDVKDCLGCGAYIAPDVWKDFLCHNLGADPMADPFTPSWKLNGAYIQWGKRGPNITNSVVDWQTAQNDGPNGFAAAPTGPSIAEANKNIIAGWNRIIPPANAWNSGTEDNPIKTANDPCPAGYRVPIHNELNELINNNSIKWSGNWKDDIPTNYSSNITINGSLLLPSPGHRVYDTGILLGRAGSGYYWSSRGNSNGLSSVFVFNHSDTSIGMNNNDRNFGFSVRCIAE